MLGFLLSPQAHRWLVTFRANRRLLKKYVGARGVGLVNGSVVGSAARIAAQELVEVKAYLDYPRQAIRMTVRSHKELRRLLAARKEPETIEWLETSLKPGDVFYDVGANVGAYALVAWAVTRGQALAYAFEPAFANFADLSQNIFLNGCAGRVIPLCAALGEKTGLAELCYSRVEAGHAFHRLAGTAISASGRTGFSQAAFTYRLDDLVGRLGIEPPTHIKIDVDGGELAVIRGGESTLRDRRLRTLLVEIDEGPAGGRETSACIEEAGFRLVSRHPKKERRGAPQSANYIFARS